MARFESFAFGRNSRKILGCVAVLGLLAGVSVNLPLLGQALRSLPSPEEAMQRAEALSPEELTQIELDEEIRDRLRFDSDWQPIAQAVRQDLMVLKWGNGQLEQPVWERYGANAYPLLAYYARSSDPTRQIYGVVGIRALGPPYTTLWLEQQIQQRSPHPSMYLLTANPQHLLDPNSGYFGDDPEAWQQDFGLDDPATRDRLVALARQNLQPESSPTYHSQFNLGFLQSLLGYEAVLPPSPEPDDLAQDPALEEWRQFRQIEQPTEAQIQDAIAFYDALDSRLQDYVLVEDLGAVEAGQITPLGKALLQAIAAEADSPDQIWAIAELDRHGDEAGSQRLQAILNGDLTQLHPLTRWVSYADGFYYPEGKVDRGAHAYYLLVGMAEKYPQSRFIQAAREYGNLTGYSYFGGEPRSPILQAQIAQKTAAETATDWQRWLSRYPDHSGADDATYFLARSLQNQGEVLAAFDLWVQMMLDPQGDRDAAYLAWPHVRTLLDVGFTVDQLETLTEQYQDEAIAPLLRYALAVHQARSQDYAEALATSQGLDLTAMPESFLSSYYSNLDRWLWRPLSARSIQQTMQATLTEQRQRWQQLSQWQQEDTPESRYRLASNWAGAGGWKNGYLAVWEQSRVYLLPTGSWDDYYCEMFWVCNPEQQMVDDIRDRYQHASQNAIALQLFQSVLDDPNTPASLREKALYMAADTLLWQWEDHPLGETYRIHPPAGVASSGLAFPDSSEDPDRFFESWEANYDTIERDYKRYIDETLAELQQTFPQSAYIDDLLFSRFAISGEPRYLQQIVTEYPEGDRALEARFLLEQRSMSARR